MAMTIPFLRALRTPFAALLAQLAVPSTYVMAVVLLSGCGDPVPDHRPEIVVSIDVNDVAGKPGEGAQAMIDFNSGGRYKGALTDQHGKTKIILHNPAYSTIVVE